MATAIVSQYVRSSVPSPVQTEASTPRLHASVYEIVTSRILAELARGVVPWRKPWRTLPPANLISKKPYRVSTYSCSHLLATVRSSMN